MLLVWYVAIRFVNYRFNILRLNDELLKLSHTHMHFYVSSTVSTCKILTNNHTTCLYVAANLSTGIYVLQIKVLITLSEQGL